GAAAHRTVDDDLGAAPNRLHDLRQHIHRTAAMIELTATVIRHIDPVDAVLDCEQRILGGRDALDHHGNVEFLLHPRDGAPVEPGLEAMAGRLPPAQHHEALGDIALAAA